MLLQMLGVPPNGPLIWQSTEKDVSLNVVHDGSFCVDSGYDEWQ